jgi:hypothetical protein
VTSLNDLLLAAQFEVPPVNEAAVVMLHPVFTIVGLCLCHSGITVDVQPGPGVHDNCAQGVDCFYGRQGSIGRDDDIGQLPSAITGAGAAKPGCR